MGDTDMPGDRDTHRAGDMAGGLDWSLVTLPVSLGMTSWFMQGLCLTLLSPLVCDCLVTNNSRAVMNLCVSCVALGGECFLALFNISCVNNSLADRAGNLALILYWPLVALPVLLVLALGTSGVPRLSLTLTIPSMSMSHYLGVMANNSRAVVDLLRCFLAMSCDDVLTLLNISSVYNNIIFLMALLALVLHWLLVTLLVWLAEALEVVVKVVSMQRISFSLTIPSRSLSNNMGVLINNSSTVVDLLSSFMAVLGEYVLTLLHISSVHNCIIFLMALLIIFFMTRLFYLNTVLCMAMVLMVSISKVSSSWSSLCRDSDSQDDS